MASRGEIVRQSTFIVPQAAQKLPIGTITVPSALERQGLARLAEMERKGQIAYAFNPRIEKDEKGNTVWRCDYALLRTPRSRVPWYVAGAAAFISASIGVGYLLWASRWVIAFFVGGVALALLLLTRLAGHSGGCVGLHCSGCRG